MAEVGYGFWLVPPALLLGAYILAFHRGRPVRLRLTCALLLPLMVAGVFHGMLSDPLPWNGALVKELWNSGEAMRSGGVLAGVLALVALGLPAVYFWNCAHGIKIFIQKLGLDKAAKPFYRLQLDETGLSIWMAGEQDKAAPSRQCDWHHIHLAYRTENAIYLYVHQTQAYLWNDSLDAGWEALKAHLPADRLRDLR